MEEQNQYSQYIARGGGSIPMSGGRRGSLGRGGSGSRSRPIPPTPGFGSSSYDSTGYHTPPAPIEFSPHVPPIDESATGQVGRDAYFQMIRDILYAPSHHLLPTLHPERPPNTFWFNHDSSVSTAIKEIFEKDFKEPFTGVRNIPESVFDRWFITFARLYHWDDGITGTVRVEFDKKVKNRLADMVGRWKRKWEKKGDDGLPYWFSLPVRESFIAYWQTEEHRSRSTNSKDTRSSSGSRCTHRSGRTSYIARGRQLAQEKGETETDLLDVLAYAKRKPDGSFVDATSESLYNDVSSRIQDLTQNSDPESLTSGELSLASKNQVFLQAAPRRRGKITGIGSLKNQIGTSGSFCGTSSRSQDTQEVAELRNELSTTKQELGSFKRCFEEMFGYLSSQDPRLAEILNRHMSDAGTSDPSPAGSSPRQDA